MLINANINSNKTIYAGWRKPNVGNVFYNLILNGSTFTTTCTNGGSMTMYYFTALSDETYKIQCSCSNSTALYFNDIDDGQSTHDPVKTFSSGGGSYSINVVKGKTYAVSFGCTSSSYETGTTVIVSLSGYWPSVTSHIGSNPDLTLTFPYGKSFYLGYPLDWIEGDFNGWFTGENGTGIRLTDENGQSVTNWNFTEDINAYPYYVY